MTTLLHTKLKRALMIEGREYVVTLTNETLKLTLKGKRNGFELPWTKIVDGEAALAVALHASVGAFPAKPGAKLIEATQSRSPAPRAPSGRKRPIGRRA